MTTAILPNTNTTLVTRWHRQIGRRTKLNLTTPRLLAAFDLLVCGGDVGSLVPVERLTFALLHDGHGRRTRFAVYGARRVPWGVSLGGEASHRLEKDLSLEPLAWARGERIDAEDESLLRLALRMDRRVDRHVRRHDPVPYDRPALPTFWGAFAPGVAERIDGDGPELNGLVHETGRSAGELLAAHRRVEGDRILFPLAWVSHRWEAMTAILADLDGMPRRQLFRLGDPAESLVGFRGACQYDLLANRFAAESGAETRHVR